MGRFGSLRTSLFLLLLAASAICIVTGQGLNAPRAPTLGSSNKQAALLSRTLAMSRGLRQRVPRAAISCNSAKSRCVLGSTAGSPDAQEDTEAILKLAGSPWTFNSADASSSAGVAAVGPAMNQQPCQTCTAFATVAAAQAAVATVLGVDAGDVTLSVVDLFYCAPSKQRTCKSGATLEEMLSDLRARGHKLLNASCLEYNSNDPRFSDVFNTKKLCAAKTCSNVNPAAARGMFDFILLSDVGDVLEAIRAYGAVVTQFDIYEGFREFFNGNRQAVYKVKQGAKFLESHAIVLVGYNLMADPPYLIAQNSWGTGWADGGLFRVDFDFPGFLAGNTWVVQWAPTDPSELFASKKFARSVQPAPANPGCCLYQADGVDFLSNIARVAGISNGKLLADNPQITAMDQPLQGQTILLCPPADSDACKSANGPQAASSSNGGSSSGDSSYAGSVGVGGASGSASSPDEQLEALLSIKAALDPAGSALTSWTRSSAAGGSGVPFCKWPGVFCNGDNVVQLNLNGITTGLKGTLPSGAALAKLPQLELFNSGMSRGLKGSLPADWSQLSQLKEIGIISTGVSGQLPASWGSMAGVQRLLLWGNALSGTLPASWGSGMKQLEELQLTGNVLTGQLPPSWGSLSNLAVLRLANNKLVGSVPPSWSAMSSLVEVRLELNAGLSGCLPRAWKGQLVVDKSSWAATKVSGFC